MKSQEDPNNHYIIDIEAGSCTCPQGKFGKFCKHECAVYRYFKVCSKNFPTITSEDRQLIYRIAVGEEKCPKLDFFEDLQTDNRPKAFSTKVSNAETLSLPFEVLSEQPVPAPEPSVNVYEEQTDQETVQEKEFVSDNEVSPPKEIDNLALLTQTVEDKIKAFTKPEQIYMNAIIAKFCNKVKQIKSVGQFENVFLGIHKKRFKSGAKINVQPTSISRRRAGLTRGSKRHRSGRPAKEQPVAKKRAHNISQNVNSNVKN